MALGGWIRRLTLALAIAPVLVPALALAQSQVQTQVNLDRFERQIQQIQRDNQRAIDQAISPFQRTLVDVGGFYTISYAAIDDAAQRTHQFMQHDLGAYARVNVDDVHELFVSVIGTYRAFKGGDAFDDHGDDLIGPKLDRAIYRFDLQRAMSVYAGKNVRGNLVIQGGRQLVHWGNGLVLSQNIDGGVVEVSYLPFTLNVVAGALRPDTVDLDPFRVNFDDASRRSFYGGMLSADVTSRHTVFAYGLVQDDRNNDPDRIDNIGGVATTTRFGYDSYYIGLGAHGNLTDRLLYSVEAAYEGGRTYSSGYLGNPTVGPVTSVGITRDHIQAWAADFRIDYLLTDPNQTRFTAEVVLASGDGDRVQYANSSYGGNKPGTSDRGFNGFGLTNTGLAFAPAVSNLLLIRGGISTTPLPGVEFTRNLQVGLDVLVFNKLVPNGPISENSVDSMYLGTEADIFANWRLTSDLALSIRSGMFLPGRALSHVPGGFGSDARFFFYSGLTLSF